MQRIFAATYRKLKLFKMGIEMRTVLLLLVTSYVLFSSFIGRATAKPKERMADETVFIESVYRLYRNNPNEVKVVGNLLLKSLQEPILGDLIAKVNEEVADISGPAIAFSREAFNSNLEAWIVAKREKDQNDVSLARVKWLLQHFDPEINYLDTIQNTCISPTACFLPTYKGSCGPGCSRDIDGENASLDCINGKGEGQSMVGFEAGALMAEGGRHIPTLKGEELKGLGIVTSARPIFLGLYSIQTIEPNTGSENQQLHGYGCTPNWECLVVFSMVYKRYSIKLPFALGSVFFHLAKTFFASEFEFAPSINQLAKATLRRAHKGAPALEEMGRDDTTKPFL